MLLRQRSRRIYIINFGWQMEMDNFGYAVASAKQEAYKRVNLYSQNGSFYSSVVFGNSETKSYKQLLFKIDGKTADVSCVSGCDYLTAN